MSEGKKDNKAKKVKKAEQTLKSCILDAISSGVANIRKVVIEEETTSWKSGYSNDTAWTLLLARIRRQQKTMGGQRVNELMLSMDAAITAAEQKVVEKASPGADATDATEGKETKEVKKGKKRKMEDDEFFEKELDRLKTREKNNFTELVRLRVTIDVLKSLVANSLKQ